jgi:DNA-binding YbaB/EbfC family protein
MQQQIVKIQEELDARVYEASSGGGMVTAKVSGKRELLELTINPQAVDPEDTELLQDMIMAAVNEALREGEETREKEMNRVSGGMGGMF